MPIFVETYRATVAPADCDHLGHMNVQHYFAAVSDGMFAIMVRLGLCPEEIRRDKFRLLLSVQRLTFTASCAQGTS
jgi:acyl-CoA thioesterase FadM